VALSNPGQPFQPFNPYPDMGGIGNMIMPIIANFMSQEFGMSPMGMGGGGNAYSNMREMKLTEDQRRVIQTGGEADREMMMNTLWGAANIAGQEWNADRQEAATSLVDQGINLAALGSPRILDQISGGRSATAMASGMFEGGRYAADPVYGDVGMSANSASSIMGDVYGQFYGDSRYENGDRIEGSGAREWRSRTDGVTSGQMGQLYSRLSREGMMGSITPMTDKELDDFENETEDGQDDQMASRRESAARKAVKTLEGWTGSLAALKEVFGENSSFDELMQKMEGMTGGSYSQLTGKQVESSMRQMVESGKLAGVSAEETMQRTQMMSSALSQSGINSVFAPQLVAGGLNFAAGYQQAGAGATPAWGLYAADRQREEHTTNVVNAGQSKVANRMGAISRLSERLGPDAFTGKARDLLDAIDDKDIPEEYADMSRGEFIRVLTDNSDLTQVEVQSALQAKTANQEMVHKKDISEPVQKLQKVELRDKFMAPLLGQTARSSVNDVIGTGEGADQLGTDLGAVMAHSISDMDAKTIATPESRNARIAGDVLTSLEEQAAEKPGGAADKYLQKLTDLPVKEMQQKLTMLAEQGYTSMETGLQRGGMLKQGETFVNVAVRNTEEVQKRTEAVSETAENHAINASHAAGVNSGGPIQRIAENLQQGGEGGIPGLISSAIGQPDRRAVAGILGAQIDDYETELESLRSANPRNEERIARVEGFRADAMRMADNYGLVNEKGEFDHTARDGAEDSYDPVVSFTTELAVRAGRGDERASAALLGPDARPGPDGVMGTKDDGTGGRYGLGVPIGKEGVRQRQRAALGNSDDDSTRPNEITERAWAKRHDPTPANEGGGPRASNNYGMSAPKASVPAPKNDGSSEKPEGSPRERIEEVLLPALENLNGGVNGPTDSEAGMRIQEIKEETRDAQDLKRNVPSNNEQATVGSTATREEPTGNTAVESTINLSGATVVLNGSEILTQAEGGIVRTGQNQREVG